MLQPDRRAARGKGGPRILLFDQHALTRKHIAELIRSRYRNAQVVTACSAEDAGDFPADLIIINLNDRNPAETSVRADLDAFGRAFPGVPITVVCGAPRSCGPHAGLRGIFPTSVAADVLVAGLRLVMAGGVYTHVERGVRRSEDPPPAAAEDGGLALTVREQEVLGLLRLGRANKLIAHELGISENTVKVHVRRIMRKLKVTNRTQAAFLAGAGRVEEHM